MREHLVLEPLDKALEARARAIAHRHCNPFRLSRCTLARDGKYHHSSRCDDLTSDILRLLASTARAVREAADATQPVLRE